MCEGILGLYCSDSVKMSVCCTAGGAHEVDVEEVVGASATAGECVSMYHLVSIVLCWGGGFV